MLHIIYNSTRKKDVFLYVCVFVDSCTRTVLLIIICIVYYQATSIYEASLKFIFDKINNIKVIFKLYESTNHWICFVYVLCDQFLRLSSEKKCISDHAYSLSLSLTHAQINIHSICRTILFLVLVLFIICLCIKQNCIRYLDLLNWCYAVCFVRC